MTFPEYQDYDALGLAELVRRGDISPLELLEAAIERIESRDGEIGAVVFRLYDQARAAMLEAWRKRLGTIDVESPIQVGRY